MLQPIRVFALFLLALLAFGLVACATISPDQVANIDEPFSLQPGEHIALPGDATLRYLRVTADSRCQPDVQCIRAGDADVAFEFVPANGAPVSVNLNVPEAPSAPIGKWQLRLLGLEFGEAPSVTVRIDANENP